MFHLECFTGTSGRRIRREAYWDGGNTYRIAFAPTEIGMWSYRLEAPEETGLSGVQERSNVFHTKEILLSISTDF